MDIQLLLRLDRMAPPRLLTVQADIAAAKRLVKMTSSDAYRVLRQPNGVVGGSSARNRTALRRERLRFHFGLLNTGGQGAPRLTEFHAGCFIAASSSATTCARDLGSPVLATGHGAPRLAAFQAGCFIAEFRSESMSARLRLEACSG